MSFFDRGKNKGGNNPPTGPVDKSEYSLFRNKQPDPAAKPAEAERSLRIVRGKGAVSEVEPETQVATPEASSIQPASATETPAKPAEPSRSGGLFSRSKKSAPTAVNEVGAEASSTNAPEVTKSSEEADAPARGSFLSKLKGKSAPLPLQQEPTLVSTPEPAIDATPHAFTNEQEVQSEQPEASSEPVAKEKQKTPEQKRKGAFLGLGKKQDGTQDAEARKKPAKEKKPSKERVEKSEKVRKPKPLSGKDAHIYVQLEGNQREFFWSIRANGLEEIGRESVTTAISFSRDDFAIKAPKALAFKAAQDLALQDIGEPVHLVNRSKDLGYVYATREERPLTAGFRLAPGQQALDRLVKRKKLVQGKPLITGFEFTDDDQRIAIAILYFISTEGEISKPQVTLNPDRMEWVVGEFAKQRKLNRKDVDVTLFRNADFLAEVGGLQAYPAEAVWQGIPVSRLWRAAAMVTLAGSVLSCGWTGLGYVQQQKVSASIESLTNRQTSEKDRSSRLIAKSIYSFADALSIDQDQVFNTAQLLWLPGTKLQVEAKPDRTTYQVKVPVVTNKTFDNKPSVDATPPKPQVEAALQIQAPPGCHKDTASVSGNMNEIEISVVCENRRSPLSGFRND